MKERGHADLSSEQAEEVAKFDQFWGLVERGVFTVRARRKGIMRLSAGPFIGRFSIGGVHLEVLEKTPGALAALLETATGAAFRTEDLQAPATELGPLVKLLVDRYLHELRSYVSSGRNARYVRHQFAGPLAGGKIQITKTVQLRARGLGHLLAFEKETLTSATDLNRALFVALTEVERISRVIEIPRHAVSAARSLAIIFQDCRDSETLFGRRASFLRQCRMLQEAEPRHAQMLALAAVILSRESFEAMSPAAGTVPVAWFLSLQDLFEEAVRKATAAIAGPAVAVSAPGRFGRHAVPIFDRLTTKFRAYPDVLIESGPRPAVLDAKYKLWPPASPERDLYQVLTHAGAYGAQTAALVYVGTSTETTHLGSTEGGCDTWLVCVDVRAIRTSLATAIDKMGILTGSAP